MLRWIKYGVVTVVVAGVAGVVVLGTNVGSYVHTTTRAARQAVKDAVPVEFELRRAGDMIEAILPDLQSQVRMIAQEEVEIAALESDITESEKQLQREQQSLTSLRGKMKNVQVSYSVNGRNIKRNQLTEQLHQRFERFKQGELALASKQRLLEKRQQSLDAALTMLEKMRHRKGELEQKVEALAAQHRLVQASKIESGRLVDGSQLSEADQLLSNIEKRLAVAQRVLAHEQDLFAVSAAEEVVDEERLLTELDEYFEANNPRSGEHKVVGVETK
ncbi:signal peptide-containing protein [Fuerstiella marisgermanici]|uniref:Chromosome partition protein Smc n=1 Tax=Fuerstiella marisgermanici TaxID=1891926 RepID=A0A1P8WC98_9PLAN|nr:signal peptide-containing protein [Fuerstiella marisgermanici]APZ91682.1 hypothetical protein Fuma_01273 [Fuerstiella marisgermanici]